jgi:succinate-semialdehyde dehydrogenase / glutarate-semialdehyde dehydrogenase
VTRTSLLTGAWIASGDGSSFPVHDPATGEEIARVPALGAAETEEAIDAADSALPTWRSTTAGERASVLRRWAALMLHHADELAEIVTRESGKPLTEARGEVRYAADFVEWFAEEARRTYGQIIPGFQDDRRLLVVRSPIGVGAAITPWNFPLAMVTRKCAPALAVGCTILLKPAEQTPLSALALGTLAERAGIPRGVLNVITADADGAPTVGAVLTGSSVVRALSFTGSTDVGKRLLASSAATVKRVSLELGGNAPFIVFADADLAAAVDGLMTSKFRNSGQTCVCANRVLVHEDVLSEFTSRMAAAVSALKVGPGLEAGSHVGPLIDESAVEKVARHVEDALAQGAALLAGGARHELGGTFFEPTLLAPVPPSALLASEETFGPVCGLMSFATEDEAVELANSTPYGLAGYVYTRDANRLWRLVDRLEVGVLGVNTGAVSTAVAPLGGVKESGLGREGGALGVEEWLETTYVCVAV